MDEIIKKIEEEEIRLKELLSTQSTKHNGILYNEIYAQLEEANRIRKIILSEQPKEPCYSKNDCEMKENGKCYLDGPCPHLIKPLTIGDKIRESNESLSGFIRGQFGDDRVFHDGKEVDIDEFLNQPTTNTP